MRTGLSKKPVYYYSCAIAPSVCPTPCVSLKRPRSSVGRWYEYLHSGTSFIDPASRPCGGGGGRLGATASSSAGDYPPECRLTAAEIEMMIAVPKEVGAAGVIIWGGGADQGNRTLCEEFKG